MSISNQTEYVILEVIMFSSVSGLLASWPLLAASSKSKGLGKALETKPQELL